MRGIWLGVVALCMVGCGLADYEKRMDEQRERIALMEEENRVLGDPIEMPRLRDPKGKDIPDVYGNVVKAPFDVFLRLPQQIAPKFKGREAIYYGEKQRVYRYSSRPNVAALVGWAKVVGKAAAAAKDDEYTPADFRARIKIALQDFITRTYALNANVPDFTDLKRDVRNVLRDGQQTPVTFEAAQFDVPHQKDALRFLVFFHTSGGRQVAVVFQMPTTQMDQARQAIDLSLKTLDISVAASARRAGYKSRT